MRGLPCLTDDDSESLGLAGDIAVPIYPSRERQTCT